MACQLIAEARAWLEGAFTLPVLEYARSGSSTLTAFTLVAAAEFGDKSQLVCMTLAARHRHWPVLLGAMLAFALLNGIAVLFGAVAAQWVPERWLAGAVALLFAGFGLKALLDGGGEEEEVIGKSGHGIFLTTFLMIFVAEFGDKTQLAVAGLSAAEPPLPVWLGATVALGLTSALGIWAGRALLQRISLRSVHIASGLLFLGFALFAGWRALPPSAPLPNPAPSLRSPLVEWGLQVGSMADFGKLFAAMSLSEPDTTDGEDHSRKSPNHCHRSHAPASLPLS